MKTVEVKASGGSNPSSSASDSENSFDILKRFYLCLPITRIKVFLPRAAGWPRGIGIIKEFRSETPKPEQKCEVLVELPTILYVDDERDNLELVKQQFEDRCPPLTVSSGTAELECLEAQGI